VLPRTVPITASCTRRSTSVFLRASPTIAEPPPSGSALDIRLIEWAQTTRARSEVLKFLSLIGSGRSKTAYQEDPGDRLRARVVNLRALRSRLVPPEPMSYLRNFAIRVRARVARHRPEIVPGRQIAVPIDIGRLICPLRYDLWVRIEFISLLRDEWNLYAADFQAFLRRPQVQAYYAWFSEIVCARYLPQLYGDTRRAHPAFIKRVHETARLWQSIAGQGYDPWTPIHLMTGRSIRCVNSKAINSIYFAGDGCHRIACLYVNGQRRLEPEHYEVLVHREFEPLDNTTILMQHLPLDTATYLRFISRFYCDGLALDSVDEILQYVACERTCLLPELKSVLAFDLPRIRAHD
jgi:hypothetical protein